MKKEESRHRRNLTTLKAHIVIALPELDFLFQNHFFLLPDRENIVTPQANVQQEFFWIPHSAKYFKYSRAKTVNEEK